MYTTWEDAKRQYPDMWVIFKNPKFSDEFHMNFCGGDFVEAVTSKSDAYDTTPEIDDGCGYTFRYTGEDEDIGILSSCF